MGFSFRMIVLMSELCLRVEPSTQQDAGPALLLVTSKYSNAPVSAFSSRATKIALQGAKRIAKKDVFMTLKPPLRTEVTDGRRYPVNCRSSPDAAVGEAVVAQV